MGRGRAKAKQTKVARRLKYSTGGTDLESLQKELAGQSTDDELSDDLDDDDGDEFDPYDDSYDPEDD